VIAETRMLMSRWDADRPWTLDTYEKTEGYKAVRQALAMLVSRRYSVTDAAHGLGLACTLDALAAALSDRGNRTSGTG